MPFYEYQCEDCGTISGFLEGVTRDKPVIKCQSCGSTNLKRLLSPSNFQMKGRATQSAEGQTCCEREERCERPPCADSGKCQR